MDAKEGILLDRDGTPILGTVDYRAPGLDDVRTRVLRFHAGVGPLAFVILPLVFALVLLLIMVGLVVAVPVWLLRRLLR